MFSDDLQCGPIPYIDNALAPTYMSMNETEVWLRCIVGYHFTDGMIAHDMNCDIDGNWNFRRDELECECIVDLPLMLVYLLALFRCYNCTSYALLNNFIMLCFFHVVTHCPVFNVPQNGHINTTVATYGTVVEYKCFQGFTFQNYNSSKTIECLATGEWSDEIEDCYGI